MGVPPFYPDPGHLVLGAVYGGKKIYDWYYPGGKMPRPFPNRPLPMVRRKRRAGGAPGVWDGKFKGPEDYSRNTILRSGFAESNIVSGTAGQKDVCYLGVASYPAFCGNKDLTTAPTDDSYEFVSYGRAYVDVWIALLRYYFRHVHAGRWEFESADASFDQYADSLLSNNGDYALRIRYSEPDGTNTTALDDTDDDANTFVYATTSSLTTATYNTLRKLAEACAQSTYYQYTTFGRVPMTLNTTQYLGVGDGQTIRIASALMWINQTIVHCRVKTVVVVQNQTQADDIGEGAGFRNAMTDISCNPLRGKLYRFSNIGPLMRAGYDLGVDGNTSTASGNEYFANNFSTPANPASASANDFCNVYVDNTNDPTGCWQTLPPRQYFKNCVSCQNVTLNPGHIKSFSTKFNFHGTLENWLKCERTGFDKDQTEFNDGAGSKLNSAAMIKGMGTCAILAMEKRIRFGTSDVQLQYQVSTHISTNVSQRHRQVMTKEVYTSAD